MRVVDLLMETGLPFEEVTFHNPPDESYAVWSEEITRRGSDTLNCITEHDVTVEVYSYDFFDGEAVGAVDAVLDRHAISYKRYETTFINSEHLFSTIFEFSFITKDRISDDFAKWQ